MIPSYAAVPDLIRGWPRVAIRAFTPVVNGLWSGYDGVQQLCWEGRL
jgi:hypothetical protein